MGEDATILDFKLNYAFLCPGCDVGQTWMGPESMEETFDILYYARGESSAVHTAISRLAVHLFEGTRMQGPFKTVCTSFTDYIGTLDSYNSCLNSYMVGEYGAYSKQGLKQAACM